MSRRAAEKEIEMGYFAVNGATASIGMRVDPNNDAVTYKGKPVVMKNDRKVYIMLNKPKGVVTTMSDEKGRKNVGELVDIGIRVYPIGRLDLNSEGLLLMTNDGELANMLTHPRHNIPKIYHVTLPYLFNDEELRALGQPIVIDGRRTQPCRVRKVRENSQGYNSYTVVEFELYEGRNRQIRRMCEANGRKIKQLTRVAIGDIRLGDLPLGKWRYLTDKEVRYLKAQA